MKRLLVMIATIGLVLGCDCKSRGQADEPQRSSRIRVVEYNDKGFGYRQMIHDDIANVSCWAFGSQHGAGIVCIPDYQLVPSKQKGE